MPTYDTAESWRRHYDHLTPAEKRRFKAALKKFIEDLRAGGDFRRGLRVKRVQGLDGCWEMTWAPDGRAIFMYGDEVRPGEPHVVWLMIGGHEILP